MLRNRLNIFPYRFQVAQHLEDHGYGASIQVDIWCLQNIQTNESFLNCIIDFDEGVIIVDGKVSKHNVRIWATENPQDRTKEARDTEKLLFGAQCKSIKSKVLTS